LRRRSGRLRVRPAANIGRPKLAAWACSGFCLSAAAEFLIVGGFGVGWLEPVLPQGFLDARGAGGADALVDRECLLQVGGALAGVAFLKVALADSFQGECFFQGHADVAGDGERLCVMRTNM